VSIATITIDAWVCDCCGHQWRIVSRENVPKRCSRCKSRTWNRSAQPKVPFSLNAETISRIADGLRHRAARRREAAEERVLARLRR